MAEPTLFDSYEQWKPIPGFESFYSISNKGRVRRDKKTRSTFAGRILRPRYSVDGYSRAVLFINRTKQEFPVHRLVMLTFVGPPASPEIQVNHRNGLRGDNRLENLEYVTPAENVRHSMEVLGAMRDRKGEQNPRAKLTESEVLAIRSRPGGYRYREALAKEFCVSPILISKIRSRQLWRHI